MVLLYISHWCSGRNSVILTVWTGTSRFDTVPRAGSKSCTMGMAFEALDRAQQKPVVRCPPAVRELEN